MQEKNDADSVMGYWFAFVLILAAMYGVGYLNGQSSVWDKSSDQVRKCQKDVEEIMDQVRHLYRERYGVTP